MPSFSARSAARLAECHPDLQVLFNSIIKDYDCTILCGARSREDQEAAVREGRSRAHWPQSLHNVDGKKQRTSWAVDVAPYPIDWKDVPAFALFAGLVLERARQLKAAGRMRYEVKWGGDWDRDGKTRDHSLFDGPHFELVGVPHGQ